MVGCLSLMGSKKDEVAKVPDNGGEVPLNGPWVNSVGRFKRIGSKNGCSTTKKAAAGGGLNSTSGVSTTGRFSLTGSNHVSPASFGFKNGWMMSGIVITGCFNLTT